MNKLKNKVPVIAGGVFATFAPDLCMKEELVDLVCVGEGENALIDLCKKIENYSKKYGVISYMIIIFIIVGVNANLNTENSSSLISWMAGSK